MITKNEAAKMMLAATGAELEKAKAVYELWTAVVSSPDAENSVTLRKQAKRAKSAAKKEVMRLLRSSIAQQHAMHSPYSR